jgi:hypothetical protein
MLFYTCPKGINKRRHKKMTKWRVVTPEWTMIVEDGFHSKQEATDWVNKNISQNCYWADSYEIESYNDSPFIMRA